MCGGLPWLMCLPVVCWVFSPGGGGGRWTLPSSQRCWHRTPAGTRAFPPRAGRGAVGVGFPPLPRPGGCLVPFVVLLFHWDGLLAFSHPTPPVKRSRWLLRGLPGLTWHAEEVPSVERYKTLEGPRRHSGAPTSRDAGGRLPLRLPNYAGQDPPRDRP
jgi:hypothetical protein